MSSLFRSLHNFSTKRENAIKEALINTLNENIRDIQYEKKETEILELCEVSSALCTTIEAIFLNGLKDSLLWQTFVVFTGDEEKRPDPSFWSPLMIFLHKQVIEQLQSLSQITSEIGLCRAWIRQSLNESLLSSYLHNISKNSSVLSPYYKKYALLRDYEGLESAANLMETLETQFSFNLPINSSLLNQWPDYALQISGLWTPPLKSCPVSSGIDVVGSLSEPLSIPTPQPVHINELFSESISNSPFNRLSSFGIEDLNHRENLELFLQKVDEMTIINEENSVEAKEIQEGDKTNTIIKTEKLKKEHKHSKDHREVQIRNENNDEFPSITTLNSGHGNSLTNLMQTSWSSDINQTNTVGDDGSHGLEKMRVQRSVSMTSSTSSLRSPADRCSYNALLKKHERTRELDWTEVWEKFLIQNTTALTAIHSQNDDDDVRNDVDNFEHLSDDSRAIGGDFEIIQNTSLDKFDIVELQEFVEQLCKLPREPGLDSQGFLCKSCQHPLGIGYSNFRVCAFNGFYYCDSCMDMEPTIIPSRIIYNWDFRKFSVSKRAMAFVAEFRCQPFIDLKLLNPEIYNASETMAELQSLRIRLNFVRAYLFTCSIDLLQQLLFGKEYLYEHIHHYSIGDLTMIQRGTLHQQLQKAYKAGENHILKCCRCSVKGFICEICKSPRVLYPFHIDTTYRCATCGAVFHAHCLNAHQPCPKCERKRKYATPNVLDSVEDKEALEDYPTAELNKDQN